ncbi:ThuA domain-containing protein [Maricaulis sp. D1M11]|uniref:ThuA domain-containing protein n=1 Tax=Maricaulis sp. D1M11 TaxID=3076117 RepID=UPI0039B6397A
MSDRPEVSEYMSEPAVLVFSQTLGWRHNEGIAGADLFFAELATDRGYGLFTTAQPGVFNAQDLARFDVIVFNNVSGEVLSAQQRQAFEDWMADGGAWIGLHGAGDASIASWTWYQDNLIGTRFLGHIMAPQFQTARVVTLSGTHPVMQDVPAQWEHRDEWYSFDRVPDMEGLVLLAGLDETSYSPRNTVVTDWPEDLAMSDDPTQHPIIWGRCTPHYRAVYSALGHGFETYRDPIYRQILGQAFDWVRTNRTQPDTDCPD